MERPYFPMFIDLTDKKILVAGGGTIALRRIRTLLKFRADIRVIAPELCEELAQLEEGGKIAAERREYCTPDIDGVQIVLAATDDHEVNRRIWEECRAAGVTVHEVNRRIWEECRAAGVTVNVADDRSLCDFYFPSIVMTEDTVIGINCGGEDHAKVKETRIKIEEMFGE